MNRGQWGVGAAVLAGLVIFPYLIAALTGTAVGEGSSKFWQSLLIEVFIMAIYAMSYDILMGYTGILSFGHAMFFGTAAYTAGIAVKHFHWPFGLAVLLVFIVAIVQGLIVGVVSLRVKGVYFAMATLAFAEFFAILASGSDLRAYTGAEDGLHGMAVPAFIDPTNERLRFYYLALLALVLIYLALRRIVNSPTGKVFVALRENEGRAQMIGYNTMAFKLIAIIVAGLAAALAGLLQVMLNSSATPSLLGINRTIDALLMTIIGGVGTLIGPALGAGVLQLLGYWLSNTFGQAALLVIGLIYILLVLFVPYGIVGTWQQRGVSIAAWRQGWRRLRGFLR